MLPTKKPLKRYPCTLVSSQLPEALGNRDGCMNPLF